MVTTDVELELTQQLKEAGKLLSCPPTSQDELLFVLDQTEKLLSMVDQSPNELMKEALDPLIRNLVNRSLLQHSDVDVKVAVASCLSEVTRITAPDAPYGDEDLKDVFRLIVSTFENLSDKSSRSYGRRASILETVCKVRSCVIMLDLECEELIVEMFDHFVKSIREHHPDDIFSSMVDIMALILEESEDITVNMLKPLLHSIRNDNEGVLPVARKLGEKVLQKSRTIIRPHLSKTLSILGDSFSNYSPLLASICEGTTDFVQNDTSALVQQQTDESKLSKERSQEEPQADESKITMVSSDDATQEIKENAEGPAETVATPNRTLRIVMSNGGRVTRKEKDSPAKVSSKKPEEAIDHQDSNLTSKVDNSDSNAELEKVESRPEFNEEGNKIDATMELVAPSDSSHGENKDKKDDDIQVSVPEVESKPEETNKEGNKIDATMESVKPSDASHGENKAEKNADIQVSVPEIESKSEETNKEGNKTDVTMTSAEPSGSSHGEDKAEKNNENIDEKNDENEDENNDDIQVSVPEVEAKAANVPSQSGNLPEERNVEKVDLSSKQVSPQEKEAEVENAGPQSQSGGLPYKIHIRKGPRSKKKSLIKDDTPLIDVLKKASERVSDSDMKSPKHAKKKALIVQKDKLPATTATPEDGKKADTVASGVKSEKKSGKKVGGGGSAKKKRKLSGKKSGGGGSGAKKVKLGGKKVVIESKPSTPLNEKDDDSDSFDIPLRQSAGKKDESDSDSKPIKLPAKKGNKSSYSVVKSSAKNKVGKKNGSGKNVEEKDQAKSLPEDDGMDISPKPAVKTTREEGKLEEASATSSKRKRSVGKNNANKNIKYDDSLIGLKVKVWWPDDKKYYEGVIESFDSAKTQHKVSYVDGDEETLNLKEEKWEILQDFSVRNEEKPEVQSTDDETLSKMITYKSKGKLSANASDSKKSKPKSTGSEGKELDDGDAAITPKKSSQTKNSGSKGTKKRKKRM